MTKNKAKITNFLRFVVFRQKISLSSFIDLISSCDFQFLSLFLVFSLEILDFIVIAVFVVDLIFLGIKAKSTKFFFKHYWLDLIAVFPFSIMFKAIEGIAQIVTAAERITVGQALFHESLEVSKAAARAERFAKAGRYVKIGARIIRVFTKGKSIVRFKRRHSNIIALHW